MYHVTSDKVIKIGETTFSELNFKESDIEELLRKNIEIICDEEESMLIVGKQVRNAQLGTSDLTAIDNKGNIVLIEIKRDRKDIETRKEAFEFQAIRYAASYATIEDIEDLVNKVYSPYIEKYRSEFEGGYLTSAELGTRKLTEFLRENGAENNFNKNQTIILAASDYDEQTLSAVAWLNSNNVDISCFKLIPYDINGEVYIDIEKVLPLNTYQDYYVNFLDNSLNRRMHKKGINRRTLPKIGEMIDWGVVKPGDIIAAKGRDDEGVLQANGNVEVNGKEISMQQWLKNLFGWSSIQTYVFAVHKESGKSLSQIRKEYMEKVQE
ncbi:hypothetical protein ERJ70_16635 [Sediminibacillus dalangtanensis]|uniref:RAMA domain-containing protein n=1 Tax=Sediminibacillus dalangtanensis TaxID=2729421 RepID=A0ABX7VUX8_9BACI|nr:hypothetical protein [Sediminibacillus dalangtanensis]QTN00762.1 hypothetical protein ERJ70_16635 [Sediminibacillus dalangtanensis]